MKPSDLLERPNWILMSFVLDSFVYRNNSVTFEDVLHFCWKQCLKFQCTSLFDDNRIMKCMDHLETIHYIFWCISDYDSNVYYSRNDIGYLPKL